jgi:hypothetical protein
MSPELHKAIAERKKIGYSEDKIRGELIEAGYDNESISLVLAQVAGGAAVPTPLPGVMTLINNALDFVKERYDLALVLAAPLVLLSLTDYLQNLIETASVGLQLLFGLTVLLSLVVYFFLTLAVLYVISHQQGKEVSFSEALNWSKRNIFKYAWLSILSGLVIWGGFMLLVIPAIILSVYLYLSQYVLTIEGKTGFAAMTRSQQLVTGAWWPLLGRLAGITLLFVVFFTILGLLLGLSTASLAENATVLFLMDVLLQLFTGLLTVCSFHIGTQLYQNRAAQVPEDFDLKPKSLLYSGLIVVSLLSFVALVSLAVMFADDMQEISSQADTEYEIEESREEAKQRAEELRNNISDEEIE